MWGCIMKDYTKEERYKIINTLCDVKTDITYRSYSNSPTYKWLNDSWSSSDILAVMEENELYTKGEVLKYLEDIAHLFGKDR